MNDPLLGGTFTTIPVGKGGQVDFKPSQLDAPQQYVDERGRLVDGAPNLPSRPQTPAQMRPVDQAPQAPRTQINRKMVIVGYKGKADAWLKCFEKLFRAKGGQTDRAMYLALDPREEERRDELMEAGARTFEKFVLIPYRYSVPTYRIGQPAPKNLDALMGNVQEEYFNAGPALLAIPFHTLHGTPFDMIEQHYKLSKMPFLGYEMVKTINGKKERMPGAILVFPPGWVTHPNYVSKKGLSSVGGTDIYAMRGEILRDIRTCEQICGSGQTPSSFACIQGFDTNEAFGPETIADPNARPPGAKAVGVPLPKGALIVNEGLERVVRPPESTAPAINQKEILDAIKATGFAGLTGPQKRAYSDFIVADEAFFEAANKAIMSQKIKAGKAKKQVATASK